MKKTITIITLYLVLISCNFSGNVTYENEIAEKEDAENITAMFYLYQMARICQHNDSADLQSVPTKNIK